MTHSSVQSPEIERFGARPLITLLLEFHVQPGQDDDFVLPFFNLLSSHSSQIIYHKLQDTCESIIIMQSQKIRRKKKKEKTDQPTEEQQKLFDWLHMAGRTHRDGTNKTQVLLKQTPWMQWLLLETQAGQGWAVPRWNKASSATPLLTRDAFPTDSCPAHSAEGSLPFSLSWQHLLYFCADCGRKLLFCCCNVFTYIVIFKCVLWYWTSWVLHFHLLLFVFHFRDFGTFAQFIKISLNSCPSEAHKITDCLILPTNFASTPSS